MWKRFFLSLPLLAPLAAEAQQHTPFREPDYWLQLADRQYTDNQNRLAAQSALQYLNGYTVQPRDEARQRMYYYVALDRLQQQLPGAADTAEALLRTLSQPAFRSRLHLALGEHFFHLKDYAQAVTHYREADIANMSNEELADAKFEMAYSLFNNNQMNEAAPLFAAMKDVQGGKYFNAGNYYYGLLAYNQSNFEGALKSFKRIDDLPEYRSIVPYYITEIYYFTGEKAKALNEAQRLLKRKDKLYYDKELRLLAGQILFEEQNYKDALPYLEYYYNNSEKVRKEELYELAYSYYKLNNIPQAIEYFKPLSAARDSLGQTAMYLLGDCYLKENDKRQARNAFTICANMDQNASLQEAALFLSAKLSYEMGYPDEAVAGFQKLLNRYPQSSFKDEAATLLGDLYARTSNFEQAYQMLDAVREKPANYGAVFQRVAYGYGLQQLNEGRLGRAMELLDASRNFTSDKSLEAGALFWLGEVSYRQQQYEAAISLMQQYLDRQQNATKLQDARPDLAYLTMGYAAMNLKEFNKARLYFGQAQKTATNASLRSVATTRQADAAFMQKDFNQAANLYDEAATGTEGEYARLQKAILMGLAGKQQEKINLLQSVVNGGSAYAQEARFELGNAQIEMDQFADAIVTLQPLLNQQSSLSAKAWLKTALAQQESGQSANAITSYRKVLSTWPGTSESKDAQQALRSIYINSNQPEQYVQLLRELKLPDEDAASLDSAFYAAAETQFAEGNWEAAAQAFDRYQQEYPFGSFSKSAVYYRAESAYRLKQYDQALAGYEKVLAQPWSEFTAHSAAQAATLYFNNGNYEKAAQYYDVLRGSSMNEASLVQAYTGLMRSNWNLGNVAGATLYADTLLSLPGVPQSATDEARGLQARQLWETGNTAAALELYKNLAASKSPAPAAEARYYLALSQFQNGRFKEAEQAAGKNISQSAGQEYWVLKSYLLLADIAFAQKDYFNAKATLESILANSTNEELKMEARQKLEQVEAAESQKSKLQSGR